MSHSHYARFGLMIVLSFIAMYILMYAMVATFSHVIPNTNQFYMAGLMTAPMVIIELLLMGMMYPNNRLNMILIVTASLLALIFFFGIRQQTLIDDEQFLKSMIPHHSGAILMCENATLSDPEIQQLCEGIIQNQEEEIATMQAILERK